MKSGDKADITQRSINNHPPNDFNDSSNKSDILKKDLNQKASKTCNDLQDQNQDSNKLVDKDTFLIKQLDNETVNTQNLIASLELEINLSVTKLNELKTHNKTLEKMIDLKLKQTNSLSTYCNYFDKYMTQASKLLEDIFDKFHSKLSIDKDISGGTSSFVSFLKINNIHDLVEGMSAIGHGGEGRVYRAFLINSGDPVVVKSYFMDCEQSSRIEYAMLVLCNNVRGVKKPIGLFQTSTNYYLVMEDDHKSIPLDVLAEKGILTENQIQHLFSQMVYILYDLRNKFIKHRDVKLDNFLLNTETGRLSIIDFGWAMYTALDQVLIEEVKRSGETLMGTFDYLPPETDSNHGTIVSYDKATVFALGCILLELFFGYQGKVRNILTKESLKDFINRISIEKNRSISKGAKSILDRCLRASPKDRLGLDEVLLHPWVPSDKIDNSIFKNFNRTNISSGQSNNTSLPCNLNRRLSANSQ